MASFPPDAVSLLERIVEKGEVDGWPPSRIMKDTAYSGMLLIFLLEHSGPALPEFAVSLVNRV